MLDTTLHVSDLLTLVGVLVGVLVFYRTRAHEITLQRAAFLREYTDDFYADQDLAQLFQRIDYDSFSWTDNDLGTAVELKLTQLLDLFNSIGFNCKNGVLKLEDVDETTLGYAVVRTYENGEVSRYLDHVDAHSDRIGMTILPFAHFRALANRLCGEIRKRRGESFGETSKIKNFV